MTSRTRNVGVALAALVVGVVVVSVALFTGSAVADHGGPIRHVLLISVDGMHQSDLEWYVAQHPDSELAKLADSGAVFSNNHTSDPSDSDPGGPR